MLENNTSMRFVVDVRVVVDIQCVVLVHIKSRTEAYFSQKGNLTYIRYLEFTSNLLQNKYNNIVKLTNYPNLGI